MTSASKPIDTMSRTWMTSQVARLTLSKALRQVSKKAPSLRSRPPCALLVLTRANRVPSLRSGNTPSTGLPTSSHSMPWRGR
ncbi:hypothetical protein JAB2_06850 [Janthinobacterium sp. HH100]|nr:hypothetical protein JAB2_06850 [Janthinobacterium sp. HH100]